MEKRRLKKSVELALYGVAATIILGGIVTLELVTNNTSFETDDSIYVNKTIFEEEIPVINSETVVIRPYLDPEIKVLKGFYDYQADASNQQNSLIYHESTYLQNSGVEYGGKEKFDVTAVLEGTVTSVKEDALLGKTVEITHENNVISIYQSLGDVLVKENDIVKQGQVIGSAGTNNITPDLGTHLHFELIIKGGLVNPETCFDKKLKDL